MTIEEFCKELGKVLQKQINYEKCKVPETDNAYQIFINRKQTDLIVIKETLDKYQTDAEKQVIIKIYIDAINE